jgi:hypothetical protein
MPQVDYPHAGYPVQILLSTCIPNPNVFSSVENEWFLHEFAHLDPIENHVPQTFTRKVVLRFKDRLGG